MSELNSLSRRKKARLLKGAGGKTRITARPNGRATTVLAALWLVLLLASATACVQQAPSSTTNEGEQTVTIPPPPTASAATGYPAANAPTATVAVETAYPAPQMTVSATMPTEGSAPTTEAATAEVFMPVIDPGATATPAASPTATPAPTDSPTLEAAALPQATPTPFPTVDFAAARDTLLAQGSELATVKHGFHVTLMEDKTLLDNWMTRLDEAGVPFFLKTVNNAEPLYEAQQLMKESGVPHVLVYRAVGDLPDYNLPPKEAARIHWELHRDQFPPELDPSLVWLETINEPDRLRSEWLAEFALETAQLAMADGFRWAAFGWAAGEPEPEHWQSPAMLEFLRLAGENPDRLAIALHEGSGSVEDAAFDYPFRTGRFLKLFEIADQHGIPRPTVLITEWGWAYDDVPSPDEAIEDIEWASRLYAPFPEVKGAAIWNLGIGCCFGDVSEQVRELIDPLTELTLTRYFERPIPPEKASTDPELYRP